MILFAAENMARYPWWAFDLDFWSGVVSAVLFVVLCVAAFPNLFKAMKAREHRIVDELTKAETVLAELKQLRHQQAEEREHLKAEAAELFAEAKRDAERMRGEMIDRAKAEADSIASRAVRDMSLAKLKVAHELWEKTADRTVQMAEETLRGLGTDDHLRLIDEAIGVMDSRAAALAVGARA